MNPQLVHVIERFQNKPKCNDGKILYSLLEIDERPSS